MYGHEQSLGPKAITESGMFQHCDCSFLKSTVHPLCDAVLLRTVRGRVFTSNAALPAECYQLIRFELSPIIGSQTLQFLIRLILDHCKLVLEDREESVFGPDFVRPNIPCGVVNEGYEIRGTT